MAIQVTARYRVRAAAVEKVKQAIAEFVGWIKLNEPGPQLYASWQLQGDPTEFLHIFIFADEAARAAHSTSAAVKRFQSVYRPAGWRRRHLHRFRACGG